MYVLTYQPICISLAVMLTNGKRMCLFLPMILLFFLLFYYCLRHMRCLASDVTDGCPVMGFDIFQNLIKNCFPNHPR